MDKTKRKPLTNTIGLEYLQNSFETEELKELEKCLADCGISLKTHENTPKHIMGLEDLFPQIQIFLSSDIVQAICSVVIPGALWDGIKLFFKSLRKMVKKKPFTHISNGKVDTNATPNIHVNIGKSHIVLPMDIDDEKFEYFVDKMFESINQDTKTEEKYAFYDAENQTFEYYSKHEVAVKSYKHNKNTSANNTNGT